MKWEPIELDDGRLGIRIDGEDDLIIVDAPPGAGRMKHVSMMVQELLARHEYEHLCDIQRQAEAALRLSEAMLQASMSTVGSPPVLAELAISLLAPKNSAQALLGDLQEMFQKNAHRFGEKQARRKYWVQVASSLAPLVWHWLKRIGFFTVLIDYCRSKLGL